MAKVTHVSRPNNFDPNTLLLNGHVSSGKSHILNSFNLSLVPGQLIVVTGQNGSGKTTLLKAIGGFLSKTFGSSMIFHPTKDSAKLLPWQVEWLPATHETPLYATIQDVMTWPRYEHQDDHQNSSANQSLADRLNSFGIEKSIQTPLSYLSLGEQKRVYLASMLSSRRKVWLMDEPTGPLDTLATTKVMSMLCKELKARNLIGVIATQDPILAARFADRWIVLKSGSVLQEGDVNSIINSDQFQVDSGIKLSIDRKLDMDQLQIEFQK